MKKIYFVATFAILSLLCGCSQKMEGVESEVVATKSELSIGLPIDISRTAIDENGKSSWTEGDSFVLWAQNRVGGFNIVEAEFKLMYYWQSYQSAVFTANINTISEGTYTYYAISPTPEQIKNQTATYTLPNEQQGDTFNPAYDILVATPLKAEAIIPGKINNLALDFQHKMHILKMTIPQGRNPLKDPISRVVFTFPTPIAGSFTINALDPAAAPVINQGSGSKQLIINTPNGIDEGDSAWGVILPSNGKVSGTVKYYAVSTTGERTSERTFKVDKEFEGGHITPLSLTIPDPIPPTVLRFSVGKNNLGEAVQKVTILDHNRHILKTFTANSANTYDIEQYGLYEDGIFSTYAGKTFTMQFESQHAIVEQQFTMPSTITKYEENNIAAVDVPYLFFEDFSGVGNFEKDDKRVASLMSANGMLFSTAVSGWNGAHIKAVAGQSIRVNVHHESAFSATRSNGRLDSPAMKCLKSDVNIRLKVEFDMGAYANSGYPDYNDIFCTVGMHTKPEGEVINGLSSTTSSLNDYNRIPGLFDSVCLTTNYITQKCNDNSFGDTFDGYSFTADGCNSTTRFGWVPCCVQKETIIANNAHYYIYIDNIKVSIAQ